ncbi:UNVERIFIED_CONTAM: hypothetical protein H355_011348, partial [Colinus virginianus]
VKCPKEDVSRYCERENALRKAYLFRGNMLIREFPTDALFDVNSIVANVLFALLFNEVKYVETLTDLQNVENALKGKSNMVFAYVPATGTAEHRAVMEVAFVYGTVHQFVLTTEVALLRGAGSTEPDASSAQLLFCHCQKATDLAQPCRRTPLEQDLTVLNIHRHLKLMGAPLVTEVAEDPEKVSTVHLQLGLPLVFILSQKEIYEADKRTAEFLAWKLLGKAGVAILSRDLVDLNILLRSNVALKTPDEGVPVKYLVLEDTEEVITLVEDKNKVEQIQENEDEDEEDEDEEENDNQDMQDDQVVEAVSRDKKRELPLDQILTLTEETFHSAMVKAAQTVVLFYASWEAVSLAVLQSYTEVAVHLKGTQGILLSRVNCWDWPGVCTMENVTQFPTIKIYKKGEQPVTYNGMLGTEELTSFIMLKNTPVGRGVLKAYFATIPSLPALVWVNLHAGGQVFKFPSEQSITEMNVLSWLERLKAGLEIPSSTLSEEDWKPPLPAYNFLQMMEAAGPEFTLHASSHQEDKQEQQQQQLEGSEEKATVREEPMEKVGVKAEKAQALGRDLRGTAPRLAGREKQLKRHSEL